MGWLRRAWHYQNLNETSTGNGLGFFYGRCWLHFGERRSWRACWTFFHRNRIALGASLSTDEGGLTLQLCFLLGTIYLSAHGPVAGWINRKSEDREAEFIVKEWSLWWSIFANRNSWSRRDPWWKVTHIWNFADILFGRAKHSEELAKDHRGNPIDVRTVIPLPEGSYPARVCIHVVRWHRSRWPFGAWITRRRAQIIPDAPLPHAGKGENSWDCDDDGIYSMTVCADTVVDAVAEIVRACLRNRARYGEASTRTPDVLAPVSVAPAA